ncbi:WSC domain-containing protein [Ophiocordyceps camponoti-floridani]|uniref:WSC domain-containing protein n=1 Tax=Ophiocordyceps camponoti-floridani TaxID=2030778 RepID=A0A8H4VGQ9_9HYPO|nr:WSC domain-containing protein [Ophiocordyceps camponoti-floridani]
MKLDKCAALAPFFLPNALGHIFTVNCKALTIQRGDPIVFPGIPSPHVHTVVGGTAFALTESNDDAKASKATTCDKVLDNSNYWQPQLYHQRRDGKFELVEMQGIAAYYIDRACDYAAGRRKCDNTPHCRAPPAGLRMVVGNPYLRTYDASNPEQRAISHVCLGPGTSNDTAHLPTKQCERLRAETFFPSCWDGVNLDSANHKSHMAFPAIGDYNTGVCPPSHPIAILSVFLEFFYDTAAIRDFNRWVWSMGDPTGYGLHGDFINGWTDQAALERAMDTCTGSSGVDDARCSLNVGSGGPGQPSLQSPQIRPPEEDVGLRGPLDRLPGDNPVTGLVVGGRNGTRFRA